MGTYIWIEGYVTYKPENEKKIVEAIHELNKRDDLKRGGDGKGQKWFAWSPTDFNGVINNVEDVFNELLRFEHSKVELEDEIQIYFNNGHEKWGQHEVFFIAMAPYLEEMFVDHTCEELDFEQQKWRLTIDENKNVHSIDAVVTVMYPDPSDSTQVTLESFNQYA